MDANELSLILMRHGSYDDREIPGGELTPLGIQEVELMAGVIASLGFQPNHIWHSGKRRAEQTAQLLSSRCGSVEPVERPGIEPGGDSRVFADVLRSQIGQLLVVSHLPFLERLSGELLFQMPDQQMIQFFPGSMLCLKRTDMDWHIKWFLHPDLIRENGADCSDLL